jgi:hypothetical protein
LNQDFHGFKVCVFLPPATALFPYTIGWCGAGFSPHGIVVSRLEHGILRRKF